MNCKLILFLMLITLVACKNKKSEPDTEKLVHQEYYGSWVGDFIADEYKEGYEYSNKINIRIISITDHNKVTGQSIVAGNQRKLTGTFNDTTKTFFLKEPGTDKYDGNFEFTINNDELKGYWHSFNNRLPVTKRNFTLEKKNFVYDKNLMLPDENDYIDYYHPVTKEVRYDEDSTDHSEELYRSASDIILKLNGSTTELKEDDLKNLKKLELEIIRNTIYARHGYTFNKKSVRQFFDPVDWYIPISDDVEKDLTPVELKNISLLKRFEKYAEDNYDTFGR